MVKAPLAGSRIRSVRIDRGLRQAELARRCDISASYLNLIEHNKRRIGGALLNRMAAVLGVDLAMLSEGAERRLTDAIETAAVRHPEVGAELDRVEDFAGRFPGWARVVETQGREVQRLERVIEGLTDRLTHDPFLSASLHEVLSSVTAIRSASAILADGGELSPEWQARFSRNILEDSRRLAESAEGLVSYLDAGANIERGMNLPQEDVEAWQEALGWGVPALEDDPNADIDDILANADLLTSPASRDLGRAALERYAGDVRALPEEALCDAVANPDTDAATLALRFGVSLPVVFRRLAALPGEAFPDAQSRGLVACDGSGTLIFRKPVPGFDLPRYGAACPLWPLYQALQRPLQPLRMPLRMNGRDEVRFLAWSFAETRYPGGYDAPGVSEAWMLIAPQVGGTETLRTLDVGASCRVCPHAACAARREPSLIALGDNPSRPSEPRPAQ